MQPGETAHGLDPADQELVERVRNGKPDDFRFLVQRYQGLLFAYLAARMNDRTLAEDAAQESLVRAFFALRKLKKPESFQAWLLGIAGRVAHELQRSAIRCAQRAEAVEALPADSTDTREEYHLEEAIATLPETHRRMILLRYYEGLSCQEMADRMDMPLGTVTKTLSRAYAELRQLLKSQEQTEHNIRMENVI